SSRRRHTSFSRDWSSDVCSSDLSWWHRRPATRIGAAGAAGNRTGLRRLAHGAVVVDRLLEVEIAADRGRIGERKHLGRPVAADRSEERRVGRGGGVGSTGGREGG